MDHDRPHSGRRLLAETVIVLLLAGCAALWAAYAPEPELVEWPVAEPAAEGMNGPALEALADDLAERNTKALLVARRGRIVLEWYAPDFHSNRPHYTAAMAKGAAAAPALAAAAAEGLLSLDAPAADWIPEWRTDPARAEITLLNLAFHASGLEDVDFDAGRAGELTGWKQRYYDHPGERFRLAVDSAASLFDAGSKFAYSGLGYYALSYIVSRALADGSPGDIPSFLGERVYEPLGIPPDAWSIGYGRRDVVDGIPLTHFGSGGRLTARAAARIGQLFVQGGCWEGSQLLDADLVDTVLGRNGGVVADPAEDGTTPDPPSAAGWWINVNRAWPSAPPWAAAALGQGHQIVWIDPELELVAVRMGGDLTSGREPFLPAIERYFVAPLYDAVEVAEPPGAGAEADVAGATLSDCRRAEPSSPTRLPGKDGA